MDEQGVVTILSKTVTKNGFVVEVTQDPGTKANPNPKFVLTVL